MTKAIPNRGGCTEILRTQVSESRPGAPGTRHPAVSVEKVRGVVAGAEGVGVLRLRAARSAQDDSVKQEKPRFMAGASCFDCLSSVYHIAQNSMGSIFRLISATCGIWGLTRFSVENVGDGAEGIPRSFAALRMTPLHRSGARCVGLTLLVAAQLPRSFAALRMTTFKT